MGWWWNSKSADAVKPAAVPEQNARNEPLNDAAAAVHVNEPIKQTLSREEQANQDLMELLKELQADSDIAKDERIQSRESGILPQATPLPSDISPDSLYPTELSCRSAFDYAMFCQSFGGQFVNVYRYGSFRSCSNHWQDFWLCMRTRNWDPKDRGKAIQEHYRTKAVKWKTGASSEDIWEVRQEPIKDAFQDSLEELEKRIEQWKHANPDIPDPWLKQQGTTFSNSVSKT